MTYLRPRNTPARQRTRIVIGIIAAFVVILGLVQWRMPRLFPAIASAVAEPFWRARFALDNGALDSADSLLAQNEGLKLQLAGLEADMASSSVAILEQQNASLLSLLGRATSTKSSYIAAAVLSRPPFAPYDDLIVDLGSNEGVSSTTLVYAPGAVLIGHVVSVLPETSTAALFSSPGEQYQVLIGPRSLPATAVGMGGGQYSAEVPHGSGIVPGDIISDLSFHDKAFGVVVSVATDPSDPFDSVLFAPPVSEHGLQWVLLDITKP